VGSVRGATTHPPARRPERQRAHHPPDAQQQHPAGKETAIHTDESVPADEHRPETAQPGETASHFMLLSVVFLARDHCTLPLACSARLALPSCPKATGATYTPSRRDLWRFPSRRGHNTAPCGQETLGLGCPSQIRTDHYGRDCAPGASSPTRRVALSTLPTASLQMYLAADHPESCSEQPGTLRAPRPAGTLRPFFLSVLCVL
jgi:hypothetical protein